MVRVVTHALLLWLVAYAGLFAITGFVLFVVRGFGGRDWRMQSSPFQPSMRDAYLALTGRAVHVHDVIFAHSQFR